MYIRSALEVHFVESAPVLFEGRFLSDPFENGPWTPRGDSKITRREPGRAARRSVQGKSIHREEVRLREWLRRFPVDAMMDLSTSARRRVRRLVPSRAELSRLLSLSLALSFSVSLPLYLAVSLSLFVRCTLRPEQTDVDVSAILESECASRRWKGAEERASGARGDVDAGCGKERSSA